MSLDSILWDINQYSIKNISKNNVYGGIKHNYIIEGIKILPLFFFTKFLINYLFEPLIYTLKGLENNVSFLDIDCDNCNEIKLYCDWCSLCNGIIETAKENIIKNPDLIKTINFNKLNICVLYTDFILIHRKHKITNKDV